MMRIKQKRCSRYLHLRWRSAGSWAPLPQMQPPDEAKHKLKAKAKLKLKDKIWRQGRSSSNLSMMRHLPPPSR